MEKTDLYLPAELQVALREIARREGRSQAQVARDALARFVATAGEPHPPSLGAFEQDPASGERVAARDAERWVREQWRQRAQTSTRGATDADP